MEKKPIFAAGEIDQIDFNNRSFTIRDQSGKIIWQVYWSPKDEQYMRKQKPGFYEEMTLEPEEIQGHARLIDIKFAPRPADWPRSRKGSQQNNLLICRQACMKTGASVFAVTTTPDQMDFDAAMDLIIARAKKDADELMRGA